MYIYKLTASNENLSISQRQTSVSKPNAKLLVGNFCGLVSFRLRLLGGRSVRVRLGHVRPIIRMWLIA